MANGGSCLGSNVLLVILVPNAAVNLSNILQGIDHNVKYGQESIALGPLNWTSTYLIAI